MYFSPPKIRKYTLYLTPGLYKSRTTNESVRSTIRFRSILDRAKTKTASSGLNLGLIYQSRNPIKALQSLLKVFCTDFLCHSQDFYWCLVAKNAIWRQGQYAGEVVTWPRCQFTCISLIFGDHLALPNVKN